MNDNFNYKENNKNIFSMKKSMLLIFTSIILIVVGYVTMNMGIFDKVSKINVNIDKKIVYEGEEKDLKVKVKTNGNFDPVVKFRSSSGKVEFSEEVQYGEEVETKITGLKPGRDTLVIDAGKELNKKEKTEEIEILVCEKPTIKNTSDKIINIKEDEKIELRFNVTRECLEGYQIYVENEEIGEIDEDYNLIGKKKGTTKIILKGDNTKTSYSLNVGTTRISVKSVVINDKAINIALGKTKKIAVNVLPSNATNRKVRYISSNESIATVTEEGKVAGIKVGTTTIRVITEDGSKTASVKVKVYKPSTPNKPNTPDNPTIVSVKSIKFGSSSYTIALNETKKLTLGIEPTNATNKTITCKSQNTSIVEVSASGNVCTIKGIKAGTTKIEAYSVDGNKKATTTVKVEKPSTTKYTIQFDLNGGTGTKPANQKVKYGDAMPKISFTKPTKAGYKFIGWYDNKTYTSGSKYYNVDGTSAKKYDKASDATLYAGWEPNKLYIQYNGNGGKWNPSKKTYSVNSDGTVILNDGSNKVYNHVVEYGKSLPSTGLVDYNNGGYMNWSKDGYEVPVGKEYFIKNTTTYLNQAKSYAAKTLASYTGCDLETKDCTIQVKVNFVKSKVLAIAGKKYTTRYSNITGFKGYPQNFAIANFGKSNEILYVSASGKGNIAANSTNQNDIELLNTTIVSKFEIKNNKTAHFKEMMYLKDTGHGQAFDYDTTNNLIIANDYKTFSINGNRKYGSNTGIMGVKFAKVNRGGSYTKLGSYNLDAKGITPIIDSTHKVFGTVKGTTVKLYDYNYSTFTSGKMKFGSPKKTFTIKRSAPISGVPSQGFALYGNYLYELTGAYGGKAYIEAFDLTGKSIYKTQLGNGYSSANVREVEGIKIYNDTIYILSTYAINQVRKVDVGYYK